MTRKIVLAASITVFAFIFTCDVKAQQWVQMNTPWTDSALLIGVEPLCFASASSALFAGTGGYGIIRSSDNGLNWDYANSGLPANAFVNVLIAIDAGKSTMVFAGCDSGAYRSTDLGTSWMRMSNGLLNDSINTFAQIENGSTDILLVGTNNGLFRSIDFGTNWEPANTGLTDSGISCLATFGSIIFAGTNQQSHGAGLFRSNDEGVTWARIDTNLFDIGVNTMTVGGNASVFVSINGFIFVSTDSGKSWTSTGQPEPDFTSSMLIRGDTLYAVMGALAYSINGDKWNFLFDQIGEHNYATAMMLTDSYLYVGAYAGIWRTSWSVQSIVASSLVLPPPLSAYPNPFTGFTTLSSTTHESGAAEVSIVNMLGEEVAQVYAGELSAGTHSFSWNAAGIPSGTYWAILRTNGSVEQVPIVLEP